MTRAVAAGPNHAFVCDLAAPGGLMTGSVWSDELSAEQRAALDPGPLVPRLDRPDVLVVGGGMVGVATALACQDAGLGSVLLVEAERLGAGATGGAAGLLIPEAHLGTDPWPWSRWAGPAWNGGELSTPR